jgi:hypothetical protein
LCLCVGLGFVSAVEQRAERCEAEWGIACNKPFPRVTKKKFQ